MSLQDMLKIRRKERYRAQSLTSLSALVQILYRMAIMWLNLKDIIEIPGGEVSFECELDTQALFFPALVRFIDAPRASGRVVNTAGVLTLLGELKAKALCRCDRCGSEFELEKTLSLNVPLSADMDGEIDDAEVFPLDGDGIDLNEVLAAVFILSIDSKLLCSDDCKGLCPACGKNLNDGPCACTKPVDPRLAVLGQLLDIDEDK